MHKVLYISYDGLTDPLGQSQILPYLEGLSKHGYVFTILSFEKPERFAVQKDIVKSITDAAGIEWVPLSFTKNPPLLSKLYDAVRMRRRAIALQRERNFDIVHCRSYIAADIGLILKKTFKTRFLFDMRGFWADEKVDNGQWNQQKLLFRKVYRYYKSKEKKFLLAADGIVSLTQAAKNEIYRQQTYNKLDVDVIPCCADLQHFNYSDIESDARNQLIKKLNIGHSARVITYLGSIGGWYMTQEMFCFFKILLQLHPEFVMMILTKDDPEIVKKEAADIGIPSRNLIVTYATRKELPLYLSISHCSVFFIKPSYSKIASSPTKHAELMGMGIPVICNNIGDTGYIMESTRTGIVIQDFSEAEYLRVAQGIDDLIGIPKQNIRRQAFQFFDLAIGISRYLEIYKKINVKTEI